MIFLLLNAQGRPNKRASAGSFHFTIRFPRHAAKLAHRHLVLPRARRRRAGSAHESFSGNSMSAYRILGPPGVLSVHHIGTTVRAKLRSINRAGCCRGSTRGEDNPALVADMCITLAARRQIHCVIRRHRPMLLPRIAVYKTVIKQVPMQR